MSFPCKGGGPNRRPRPWRLTDSNGFLNAPGDFPGSMAGDSAETLSSPWYWEARGALNTIAPKSPIPDDGDQIASWFNEMWRTTRATLEEIEVTGRSDACKGSMKWWRKKLFFFRPHCVSKVPGIGALLAS